MRYKAVWIAIGLLLAAGFLAFPFVAGYFDLVNLTRVEADVRVSPGRAMVEHRITFHNPWPVPVNQTLVLNRPWEVVIGEPLVTVQGAAVARAPSGPKRRSLNVRAVFPARADTVLLIRTNLKTHGPSFRLPLNAYVPGEITVPNAVFRFHGQGVEVFSSRPELKDVGGQTPGFYRVDQPLQGEWDLDWTETPAGQ